jgi:hypothetical protein
VCTILLRHEQENAVNIISPSSTVSAVTTHDVAGTAARRRYFRATAVFAAAAAASAIWLLAHAAGADFTMRAAGKSLTIVFPMVIVVTLWFGGVAWAAIALLERYTSSAARIWTRLAAGILLLSFVPIFAEHANAGTRTALVLIHLTVATVLISALRRTAKG